jgi:hypothetical protein
MKSALRLALVAFPFVALSCASDPPAPREPVVPVASTPPGRPNPVPSNPGGVVPPTVGGSGGSPGTGGAGGSTRPPDGGRLPDAPGSDTPPAVACTMTVTAAGNAGLIDNFNDNNASVPTTEMRAGTWETRSSATAMITNQAMPGVPELPMISGANGRGLRVRGMATDPADTYGAEVQVTFSPDPGFCYDASAYTGLQLQIRGLPGTRVFVQALTASVRALNAATPDAPVGGHYRALVTINSATALQTVTIPWAMFQEGWGTTPGPNIDPKQIYGLAIVTAPRAAAPDAGPASIGAFDFTIDNVAFTAAP